MSTLLTSHFYERRSAFMAQCEKDSIFIIAANTLLTRSNDTEYPFRQNSDFWYLTGFGEPDAYLILSNRELNDINDGKKQLTENIANHSAYIFVQPSDALAEIWHGRRLGVDRASKALMVDQAFSIDDLDEHLPDLLDGHKHLYYCFDTSPAIEATIQLALKECRQAPKQSKTAPNSLHNAQELLHAMRLIKSEEELAIMQKAADISSEAHARAMSFSAAGKFEYQLEAELHHEFAMSGARYPAYGTIVGSGVNACILHYTENKDELKDGDLVLIDAGCELQGYAADITRTFPVNGKFSDVQRSLYQLVLDSQYAAINALRPDATISEAMKICVRVLVEGLVELGILKGAVEANIEAETWRSYFMHGLGHWLGLDVHDVGIYKENGLDVPLRPGMVMTVEPGLYFSENADVDARYRGIGIRIEDNIVITDTGNRVLTDKVPKEIAGIEKLMSS
ncbi:Xaa-Pro aminopeptidase [Glaciecola sp. MH2013]|uniref:Xaa-Pro aminopeptidase n=1 Tax=Glaciecola sp. MH2013 TaxID=2785524 RepID=UPI00189CE8FA|nr:Xaa-Pro aminopeptidase [Glaciecola sp. MH2013]MBF7072082.1 Xaa-Pro aminopeptidase [Glaciecola sp. MH2013]